MRLPQWSRRRRPADALRADFIRQPSVGAYRVLLDFAAGLDRVATERAWAMDHAKTLASDRFEEGAVLVNLLMSDGDIDGAWDAAERYYMQTARPHAYADFVLRKNFK